MMSFFAVAVVDATALNFLIPPSGSTWLQWSPQLLVTVTSPHPLDVPQESGSILCRP